MLSKHELNMATTNCFTIATLAILIFFIYANSLHSPWHYDDYLNIVENSKVHLKDLSWKSISNIFDAATQYHSKIARPLAYFSFAMNFYFHGDNVFGFHIVNILVHFFAAFFLFLLLKSLLQLPVCRKRYCKNAEAIACLAVLFWASHPIHVTAVTYIVQRMTSLAAMFYILGVYFFVKARQSMLFKQCCLFYGLSAVSGILAFGCKENAIMFPFAIILLEMFLFRYDRPIIRLRHCLLTAVVLGGIYLISSYYLDWSNIHQNYKMRPFSMAQRLLTEPRIIIFYLSLLIYPTTSRLSLIHDFPVSTTFFQPWTTLPAILMLFFIIAGTFLFRRKHPLIAYCILFFFLNQFVEGSVLSLELIYEHRNYLPSMLLFLPLSIAIIHLLDYFKSKWVIYGLMAFCTAFVIMAHGHTTYMYNRIFKESLTLWRDNAVKYPNLSITRNNYGQALRMRGYNERAAKEFNAALQIDRYQNLRQKGIVLYNIGLVSAYEENDHAKAFNQFSEARQYLPNHPDLIKHLAIASLILKKRTDAHRLLNGALELWPRNYGLIEALGIFYLDRNRPIEAFHLLSSRSPGQINRLTSLYILARACRDLKDNKLAITYWEKVMKLDPVNPMGALSLSILYSEQNQPASRNHYLGLLIYLKGDKSWGDYWQFIYNQEMNRFFIPDTLQLRKVLSTAEFEKDL